MNRKGVALAAALLVVLLAGVLVTTSTTWAMSELRAAEAWSSHARAESAAATLVATALPRLHQWFDSIPPGTITTLPPDSADPTRTWTRGLVLGDSLLLLEWENRHRTALGRMGLIARLSADSTGARPYGAAPVYHPLP